MPDLSQQYGADIAVGPTGDLAVVTDSELGQQRVLRRLLTNAGDDVWHPQYGAGLAQFVGQPTRVAQIRAVIRSQIFQESAVARTPEPLVEVSFGGAGTVYVHLRYADAQSGETQILSFSAGA